MGQLEIKETPSIHIQPLTNLMSSYQCSCLYVGIGISPDVVYSFSMYNTNCLHINLSSPKPTNTNSYPYQPPSPSLSNLSPVLVIPIPPQNPETLYPILDSVLHVY